MQLFERVKEILKKYGLIITATVLSAGTDIGAVIGAITNSLNSMGKGVGKGLQEINKKNSVIGWIVSFIFKSAGTGHLIFCGTAHLDNYSCRGRLFDGTVPQTQPLTLPNKQTCQKNCSHKEQRLDCIMASQWRRELWC